ncbi:putative reverse transcriptase domain-containing protein, partial [Tanacetum coccineum]
MLLLTHLSSVHQGVHPDDDVSRGGGCPSDPKRLRLRSSSEESCWRLLAIPTPTTITSLSITHHNFLRYLSPPLPLSSPPHYWPYICWSDPLGSRATGIRQRDALPSPIHETEMPEICLPLRKRPCHTTPGPGYEVGESSAVGTAKQVGPATARADLYGFADNVNALPGSRRSLRATFHRALPFDRGGGQIISCCLRIWSMDACESVQLADRRRLSMIFRSAEADYREIVSLKSLKKLEGMSGLDARPDYSSVVCSEAEKTMKEDCKSRPATANNNNNNRNRNNNNNNRNNNNPRAQGANSNAIVCFECGAPGHFRNNCPQWKNKNQGNGNGVARAYAVGVAGQNPDNNVVTGTFLLNNRCASILFDTGADRSFVSTQFSTLINIAPTTLDHGYNVELADGRIIWVNT